MLFYKRQNCPKSKKKSSSRMYVLWCLRTGSKITRTSIQTLSRFQNSNIIWFKNIHNNIFSLKSVEKKRIFSIGRKNNILVKIKWSIQYPDNSNFKHQFSYSISRNICSKYAMHIPLNFPPNIPWPVHFLLNKYPTFQQALIGSILGSHFQQQWNVHKLV